MTRRKDPRTPRLPAAQAEPLSFTPVPRQRMRRGGWSAARQREFIEHLADTGSVRAACRRMGVGEHHIYKLRNHAEGTSFRAAWEAALDMGIQRIEDVAMDRALNGVDTPVFYHGEEVGQRKVYNDRLLMFLLNNRAPNRFAHGNARSQGSISPRELERLKKQWIAEHEAKKRNVTAAEVRASIDRKITEIRRRFQREAEHRWAALSEETRKAWADFISLRDRDLAAMNADTKTRAVLDVQWEAAGDHFEAPEVRRLAGRTDAADADEAMSPVHQWQKPEFTSVQTAKTTGTIKDEGFGRP